MVMVLVMTVMGVWLSAVGYKVVLVVQFRGTLDLRRGRGDWLISLKKTLFLQH